MPIRYSTVTCAFTIVILGVLTFAFSTNAKRASPSAVSISIGDATVNEGKSGTTSPVFNVTLSSPSAQTISVNYATANGTASSPSDYVGASGTVTFAPGQTSQPISIQAVGDTANESNENFFVNLSGAVNATVGDGRGVGTIVNLSYFEIPVYFHIIQDTNGNGFVDASRLDAQIVVFNNAFNGASAGANVQFFFWTAGVTRTTNKDWFEMDSTEGQPELPAEYEAKRVLHQGGSNALNLYTVRGGAPRGTPYEIAWARLPQDYAGDSCRDGVVVPFTRLPGDTTPGNPYNAGDIPVHEVGHWLGLFHTFTGGCDLADDQVDDTPRHLNESIGKCPSPLPDTCPSSPGTDPIDNYMTDYSDECKSKFTRGQFERMRDQFIIYRQSSTPPPCPVVTISINDVTVNEGNSGATTAPFTVTVSNASTQTVYVDYATANGTAGPLDFFGQSGTLSFGPDKPLSQSIPIQVLPDTTVEANETFFVNLSNPRNATIADGQGVGIILNDDASPSYYEIVARHSGKCLDVEGESMASGARVIQFVCGGWPNQQWQVIPVGGGYSKIVARHSGKVLDVQWAGLANGTPVWQWEENGSAAQQWAIIDVGGGYNKIVARHSGRVLDVQWAGLDNNTPVWQWEENGSGAQQWLLRPVP